VKLFQKWGQGEIKENDGRGEFNSDMLICHNVTIRTALIIKGRTEITP
jgi:hypothetical protein